MKLWCQCCVVVFTGGVQVICKNLVDTNRRLINTSPSLVSSIMQYFGSARPDANNGRRSTSYSDSPADTAIQNFAVLGQHITVIFLLWCSLYSGWAFTTVDIHRFGVVSLLFCSYSEFGQVPEKRSICEQIVSRLDTLLVARPKMSGCWKELKALTSTSEHHKPFPDPPADAWERGSCTLYEGCPTPVFSTATVHVCLLWLKFYKVVQVELE